MYLHHDDAGPFEPAASITTCGTGSIAAVCLSFAEEYLEGASFVASVCFVGPTREPSLRAMGVI